MERGSHCCTAAQRKAHHHIRQHCNTQILCILLRMNVQNVRDTVLSLMSHHKSVLLNFKIKYNSTDELERKHLLPSS